MRRALGTGIILVVKSCKTFAENYFMNLIFLNWHCLCFRSTKYNYNLAKRTFSDIETHLTVAPLRKTGLPEHDSPHKGD